jgi:hypothetical protein
MKRSIRLLLLSLLPIGGEILLHSMHGRLAAQCCDPSACDGYCGQNADCSCISAPTNCECGVDGCDCATCWSCGCSCGCGCVEENCY